MARFLVIEGRLHTPYFVFVRCASEYSDAEFLQRFGLCSYQRAESIEGFGPYAIVVDVESWKLLADDWQYNLWQLKATRKAIADLAERHELFACSVGECDHSFDFVYYRNGQLVRKYVVVDPSYSKREVVEDFGVPLPGEIQAFENECELGVVLGIAASLGIRTTFEERDVRIYVPTKSRRHWWSFLGPRYFGNTK